MIWLQDDRSRDHTSLSVGSTLQTGVFYRLMRKRLMKAADKYKASFWILNFSRVWGLGFGVWGLGFGVLRDKVSCFFFSENWSQNGTRFLFFFHHFASWLLRFVGAFRICSVNFIVASNSIRFRQSAQSSLQCSQLQQYSIFLRFDHIYYRTSSLSDHGVCCRFWWTRNPDIS